MKQTPVSQSIRLRPDVYKKLKLLADNEDRSFNKYTVRILEDYIEQFEKEHGVINLDDDK